MANVLITTQVQIVGSEETKTLGSLTVPLSISLNASSEGHYNKIFLANATLKEVFRAGSADGDDTTANPKMIALKPSVDTLFVIVGTATTDNSALYVEAGHVFVLTSGQTTEYAATYTGRAAASAQNITKIYGIQSSGAASSVEVLAAY